MRILDLTEKAEGKLVWVIGDIHGEYDLFCSLLNEIGYQKETHLIVSVGDLVDRGSNSPAVVDWFSKNGYSVRGNHEEMWLETRTAGMPYDECGLREAWTLRHHGAWLYVNGMDKTVDQFMDAGIPASQWMSYFESLPYAIEIGEWLIVHAGVNPSVPFARQSEKDLLWIRECDFVPGFARHYKRMVCGHTETFHFGKMGQPLIRADGVWIDIGTANQIALAAFCLNTEEAMMVDHPHRAVAESRIRHLLNRAN